jgi:hypothetical protein
MDVDGFSQFGQDLFIDREQEDAAKARLRRSSRCSDHFTELSRQPRAPKSSRRALSKASIEGFGGGCVEWQSASRKLNRPCSSRWWRCPA